MHLRVRARTYEKKCMSALSLSLSPPFCVCDPGAGVLGTDYLLLFYLFIQHPSRPMSVLRFAAGRWHLIRIECVCANIVWFYVRVAARARARDRLLRQPEPGR